MQKPRTGSISTRMHRQKARSESPSYTLLVRLIIDLVAVILVVGALGHHFFHYF